MSLSIVGAVDAVARGVVADRRAEHEAGVAVADTSTAPAGTTASGGSSRRARSASRSRGRRRRRRACRRAPGARPGRARGRRRCAEHVVAALDARRRSRPGTRTPSPSFSGRRSTSIWPSSAATRSASSAVPSGLLSSTTSTSASGIAARVRRRNSSMFSASWYVGVITSVRTAVILLTVSATPISGTAGRARSVVAVARRRGRMSAQDPVRPRRTRLAGVVGLVPVAPRSTRGSTRSAERGPRRARSPSALATPGIHLDVVGRRGRARGSR